MKRANRKVGISGKSLSNFPCSTKRKRNVRPRWITGYMEQLEHLSFKGQKALFVRLEELARIANMNKKERAEYEAALKIYRDNENVVTTARREGIQIGEKRGLEKGRAEGRAEGILITARLMKQNGISFEQIKLCTGLSDEEIENL